MESKRVDSRGILDIKDDEDDEDDVSRESSLRPDVRRMSGKEDRKYDFPKKSITDEPVSVPAPLPKSNDKDFVPSTPDVEEELQKAKLEKPIRKRRSRLIPDTPAPTSKTKPVLRAADTSGFKSVSSFPSIPEDLQRRDSGAIELEKIEGESISFEDVQPYGDLTLTSGDNETLFLTIGNAVYNVQSDDNGLFIMREGMAGPTYLRTHNMRGSTVYSIVLEDGNIHYITNSTEPYRPPPTIPEPPVSSSFLAGDDLKEDATFSGVSSGPATSRLVSDEQPRSEPRLHEVVRGSNIDTIADCLGSRGN
jgi:hypothetical protein